MSRTTRQRRRAARRAAKRTHLLQVENLRASPLWAHVVQAMAFVRKELVEVLRQPRLLVLLIAGPFVVLLLFGAGYRNSDLAVRTLFVGPAGSIYEDAVSDYEDVLAEYIDPQGFTDDEAAARRRLNDGGLDVVVVFPPDPLASIANGESAKIEILHEELDPFQQAAIEIAARLAVQEVNTSVLGRIVGEAQTALRPASELSAALADEASSLMASADAGDGSQVVDAASSAVPVLVSTRTLVGGAASLFERLGGAEQAAALSGTVDDLDRALEQANAIASDSGESADLPARSNELAATLQTLAAELPTLATIDPAVLVRPFESATENLVAVSIDPTDYYAPSSVVLLLQHLALTFAALSLVPRATKSTWRRPPASRRSSSRSGSRASSVRRTAAGCSAISVAIRVAVAVTAGLLGYPHWYVPDRIS